MSKTTEAKATEGKRTHTILMYYPESARRDPKFAGYAIDGKVRRNGKYVPVSEWVDHLNESTDGDGRFFEAERV